MHYRYYRPTCFYLRIIQIEQCVKALHTGAQISLNVLFRDQPLQKHVSKDFGAHCMNLKISYMTQHIRLISYQAPRAPV